MFLSYLKIAIRNLTRYRGLASINLFGLAVGMACTMFILLWVQDELSFDRYHTNADVLYRVEQDQFYSGEAYHVNVTPYPPGPVFKSDIPEVVDAARFAYVGTRLVGQNDRNFYEGGILAADPSVFDMFTFPFVEGDSESAFNNPNSIVLSQEMALKYFSNESPIGKTVSLDNEHVMTVTGVIENVPSNSWFEFDMLVPFEFLKVTGQYQDIWGNNSIYTFVQLHPLVVLSSINEKLTAVINANREGEESLTQFMAMPLTDIHLKGYFGYGRPMGNIKYIYVFSAIALFVLLIACINFMNLSTARSARRAKEIGLRKTAGAGRSAIARQFLSETVFLSFIALLFAITLIALLLGPSNALTGKELGLDSLFQVQFLLGAIAITLFTGIIAGSYPAIYLSSFRPSDILKGGATKGAGNAAFRRILVVVQFGLSIFLIIGTGIVYQQLNYMKDKDLGYDQDHLVTIRMRSEVRNSYQTLKSEWLSEPTIRAVTAANFSPTNIGSNSSGSDWAGKDPDQTVLIGFGYVDFDYTESLGIVMAEGRDFSKAYPSDVSMDSVGAFIVNQSTADLMNMDSVIGEEFSLLGVTGPIIGVMEDFHYNSLRVGIEPLALMAVPERLQFAILRLDPSDITASIAAMEATWNRVIPSFPFEFSFLDEAFERMYRSEERMSSLLGYFSLIAVLIACLGLIGLAAFTAEQRRKEISIRKVLGASPTGISFLLCKEFLLLIAVANVLAWPVAYYAANNWLQSFAYRQDLQVAIFILTGVSSFAMALLTVSYQAIKAALANPVEALNCE